MNQLNFNHEDMNSSSPQEELKELLENHAIRNVDFPNGVDFYEDNIQFRGMVVEFDDDSLLTCTGYNALYELMCFHKLSTKYQQELNNELLEWITSYYEDFLLE